MPDKNGITGLLVEAANKYAESVGHRPHVPPGTKLDQGKPRVELIVPGFILAIGRVLCFGALKYEIDNWQHVKDFKRRYQGAAMRHLLAYMDGEINDPESGESHLAHCACCLMFLWWGDQHGKQ